MFVAELRGFNDSLESLFPGAKFRIAQTMKHDINAAVEIGDLQLLQEATAGDHEDLSEQASVRLETLGATVSARTELLPRTISDRDHEAMEEIAMDRQAPSAQEQSAATTSEADSGPSDVDELTKRLDDIELYMAKKGSGALVASLKGHSWLGHVSAHVHWIGCNDTFPHLDEHDRGIAYSIHDAFSK